MARVLLPWLLLEIAAAVYDGDRSRWKAYPQPSQYHDARKDAQKHTYSSASVATGSPEELNDGRTSTKMRGWGADDTVESWRGKEEAWRSWGAALIRFAFVAPSPSHPNDLWARCRMTFGVAF